MQQYPTIAITGQMTMTTQREWQAGLKVLIDLTVSSGAPQQPRQPWRGSLQAVGHRS